jgi:hypothetical protein
MELNGSRSTSPQLGTSSRVRRHAFAVAAAVVLACVLAACGSVSGQHPSQAGNQSDAGFAGYKWTVVAITHQGKTTVVPAGDDARTGTYLLFTPDGHFGANEPVNYHGGTYTVTPGGFTTHGIYQTLVGFAGPPSVEIAAISAFDDGTHASAEVSGNTLMVSINGYTMTARRAGRQANFPPPAQTSGPPPRQASAQPGRASASTAPAG